MKLLMLSTMALSFNYGEFVSSKISAAYGIQNTPSISEVNNGKELYNNIIDPIRNKFGEVEITSGYRNLKLNTLIGGAKNSQHMLGQAVDIKVPDVSRYDVANWIIHNLEYDQLIMEPSWIHISYSIENNRKETLQYVDGKVIPYTLGQL
jgi:hypothetical protein